MEMQEVSSGHMAKASRAASRKTPSQIQLATPANRQEWQKQGLSQEHPSVTGQKQQFEELWQLLAVCTCIREDKGAATMPCMCLQTPLAHPNPASTAQQKTWCHATRKAPQPHFWKGAQREGVGPVIYRTERSVDFLSHSQDWNLPLAQWRSIFPSSYVVSTSKNVL